ncbi:hypothetical protein PI124_g21438 [Phytophthora idaei]|nr:hypothetical protein PI125_g25629 [Phytophthora idaei]KAG3127903.1 hypothetical protein PI126_g21649 [Phytophthora idaei]KAG3233489.1 hypothetical protein PI124_g21438 [Phytophthora idaei]
MKDAARLKAGALVSDDEDPFMSGGVALVDCVNAPGRRTTKMTNVSGEMNNATASSCANLPTSRTDGCVRRDTSPGGERTKGAHVVAL